MSKSLAQQIVDSGSDPRELERLYRGNPKAFTAALPEARVIDHESIVLRVWEARLFLDRERAPIAAERQEGTDRTTIWLIIFLCAISGTIAKLPAFFPTINSSNYYSRDFAFFFLPAIAGYFATSSGLSWKRLALIAAIFVIAAVAINAYPPLYLPHKNIPTSGGSGISLTQITLLVYICHFFSGRLQEQLLSVHAGATAKPESLIFV